MEIQEKKICQFYFKILLILCRSLKCFSSLIDGKRYLFALKDNLTTLQSFPH